MTSHSDTNMSAKINTEVHFKFPKLRDWVVFKEDDKYYVTKKSSISTPTGIIYTGMYSYGDTNS